MDKFKWEVTVAEIPEYGNNYFRVMRNIGDRKVIAIVDMLDNSFVKDMVKNHNENISMAYEQGLRDGIKLKDDM